MAEGYKLIHRLVYVCEECGADSSVPHMVKHFATCPKAESAEIAKLREALEQAAQHHPAGQRTADNLGVCPQCGAGLHEEHKPTCDYRRR